MTGIDTTNDDGHAWTYTCPSCLYQAHGTTELVARRRFFTSRRHARQCERVPS